MAKCIPCNGTGRTFYNDAIDGHKVWTSCGLCNGTGVNQYERSSKSKNSKKSGGCFIATAAFGDYKAPEVIYLSNFRDETLSRSILGRSFIRAYYAVSPRFAAVIAKSDFLRSAVRKFFLQPMIFLLRQVRH